MLTPVRGGLTGGLRRAAAILAALLIAITTGLAQTPGRNVNMVTKDPYLQKQNEPSIAVSSRNPCHLVAMANDYRTVNLPGLPDDQEIGDSWVGLYQSFDCGATWMAGLVPGYPQDASPLGMQSPVKGLGAAADPTMRAGLAGFFAGSFIAFNRGTNVGALALARFVDENNVQITAQQVASSDPFQVPLSSGPIKYLGTTLVASGSSGRFLDKPTIAVAPGPGTCTLNGNTVPATAVHFAWTEFVGNGNNTDNIRTKVYYAKSSNCGASMDGPSVKLSEGHPINQGTAIAVAPNGHIYVAWREFERDFTSSYILFTKSTDGGKTFPKAVPIPVFLQATFFDQATSPVQFRTTAFPSMAVDHTGRIHLAVAVRALSNAQRSSRILMTSSSDGGANWSAPTQVSPSGTPEHQIMPALSYGAGKLHLTWYDLIDDASITFGEQINEAEALQNQSKRHTIDLRGATGTFDSAGGLTFATYGVLQLPGLTPKTSQYKVGEGTVPANGTKTGLKVLQSNRPNLKLYGGGTLPFMGDYNDIAGLVFVPQQVNGTTTWVLNTPTTAAGFSEDVHAVWTDNRDANVDVPANPTNPNLGFTAAGLPGCDGATVKTRNANVYTSRISPGVSLLVPVNAKQLDGIPQRAFPVIVTNSTRVERAFRLRILSVPANTRASFLQFDQGPIVTEVPLILRGGSSAVRTVHVSSSLAFPAILIEAREDVPTPTLIARAVINPDGFNPRLGGSLATAEVHNPDIENPDIENPDIENPDIENPDIENPDIENPDIENPDIENPDIENPDIENPDIENPDIENPDIENPDIENGAITDVSFDVENEGTDATGYQVDVEVDGPTSPFLFQLIAHRVVRVPNAGGCTPGFRSENQILFNIPNPDIAFNGFLAPNDPTVKNGTIYLMPGEKIRVTLRVWDRDVLTGINNPAQIDRFCPFIDSDSFSCKTGPVTHIVRLRTRSMASNTGETGFPTAELEANSDGGAPVPLTITTTSIPPAVVGQPYLQVLRAIGGVNPGARSWSVQCIEGECDTTAFAHDLTLSADGRITGVPSEPVDPGTQTVVVSDGVQADTQSLPVLVLEPSSNVTFIAQPPPAIAVQQPFSVSIRVVDNMGAVLPGVNVALALLHNPTGALVSGPPLVALTNEAGIATFPGLRVDTPGDDYQFVATATTVTTTVGNASNPFDITTASPLVVTNANDAGPGSLRAAIAAANAQPAPQMITFDIPGNGLHTITLASPLVVTDSVGIDGLTQPGAFPGSPTVVLDGASAGLGASALTLQAGSSLVQGLNVVRAGAGITVISSGNVIRSNIIGTNAAGSTTLGNAQGIFLGSDATKNIIGGISFAERNIIGGNTEWGIAIAGQNNHVLGNLIGSFADDDIGGGAPNGSVGATNSAGIMLLDGAAFNLIGNMLPTGSANIIMGNNGPGISLSAGGIAGVGPAGSGNKFLYNQIDLNTGLGIDIGHDGITPNDPGNPEPPTPPDFDNGPNDLQNSGVVTQALRTNGETPTLALAAEVLSTPGVTFMFDFYVSPTCGGTTDLDGRLFIGGGQATANALGLASFSGLIGAPAAAPVGSWITVLITHPTGSTSEFSPCVQVIASDSP